MLFHIKSESIFLSSLLSSFFLTTYLCGENRREKVNLTSIIYKLFYLNYISKKEIKEVLIIDRSLLLNRTAAKLFLHISPRFLRTISESCYRTAGFHHTPEQ